MYMHAKFQNEKLKAMEDESSALIDKHTGKPLFRPQTGRLPHNRVESQIKDIGTHLHDMHKKQQEKL